MKKNKKNAFTLVELLAVIVILAIILVIAVPKVMSVIGDSKKATLESTAKMIASSAEKVKVQNTLLGKNVQITCDSVVKLNDVDYEECEVEFEDNTAKVSIKGSGKFAGLYVCSGTKIDATATSESCTPVVNVVSFEDDDWSTIVAAVKQAVKTGTPYPYEVGNTKTIDLGSLGTHTIRVSNTTPCSEVSAISKSACGFVLEFADIITGYDMNPAGEYNGIQYDYGTNIGGWPESAMYDYVNGTIYNALPEKLKIGIINTYVLSSSGKEDLSAYENVVEENFYSMDKLYLLSPQEVYGTLFVEQSDKSNGTSRQLDYYTNYQRTTKIYQGGVSYWWLRSTDSTDDDGFFFVNDDSDGYWHYSAASAKRGVSPAFRLAN